MFEEEKCFKCKALGSQVKLFDAINENEIVKICENCSKREDIPIIRKPTTFQLKESEKPYSVYERLSRAAGLPVKKKNELNIKITKISEKGKEKQENIGLNDLITRKKQRQQEKERLSTDSFKNKHPLKLVDNFHWKIMLTRRKKNLTRRQLAEFIGESEAVIKMVEQKQLPEDDYVIIGKLESFLGINLRKSNSQDSLQNKRESPARILSFKPDTVKNLTIADLRRMKKKKNC